MFARPRPKKGLLPPPSRKRKAQHTIEEIKFDNDSRADYLTGFHKRKLQRAKNAQEQAARQARQEKIELRKQVWPHLKPVESKTWPLADWYAYRYEKAERKRLKIMSKTSRRF